MPTRCGSTCTGCLSSRTCGRSSASEPSSFSPSMCAIETMAATKLSEGDTAPDFDLVSDQGTRVKLSDQRGKRVVLFFYPKDDTPGCTRQACGMRDNYSALQGSNAVVFGVSPDDQTSHQAFKSKFSLPFPLLVDE